MNKEDDPQGQRQGEPGDRIRQMVVWRTRQRPRGVGVNPGSRRPGQGLSNQGLSGQDSLPISLQLDPLLLGASLYTPATRPDLADLGNGDKRHGGVPDVSPHSLIYCLEDSVRSEDLPLALARLQEALPQLRAGSGPLRFVRVRDPRTLEAVLNMDGWQALHGFVLPKSTRKSLRDYLGLLPPGAAIMPTLETREVFSQRQMESLRDFLLDSGLSRRILTLPLTPGMSDADAADVVEATRRVLLHFGR